ncbi:hypothetical protein [Crocosphaera sp. XPORK-15E]|uniref:helix-turn-helix transcriptional regulator n=1 Tax=Crocosphaera sp. XPORK-15E TaxID=3110247 RepID=UPI002B21508F|nr:hypothetical protein [Crocosphaera sp. XPORK-15E]MEA5537368.1 hypothetical protein [Crocosphaera sp. XPORK-15E]
MKQTSLVIESDSSLKPFWENFCLTPRQNQLIFQLTHAVSKQDILKELGIKESTYRYHLAQLKKLFGVSTTSQLVAIVFRSGYITNLESQ